MPCCRDRCPYPEGVHGMNWVRRAILRITATAVSCAAMLAPSAALAAGPAARTGSSTPATHAGAVTLYVANNTADTVTPISAATNTPGKPIPVRANPTAIAITPNGKTAYVLSGAGFGPGYVTPVNTATNKAGTPIKVNGAPVAIAITPDGKTAYVAVAGLNEVVPIVTATNTTLPPIRVGPLPGAIAITPDGTTAYA